MLAISYVLNFAHYHVHVRLAKKFGSKWFAKKKDNSCAWLQSRLESMWTSWQTRPFVSINIWSLQNPYGPNLKVVPYKIGDERDYGGQLERYIFIVLKIHV